MDPIQTSRSSSKITVPSRLSSCLLFVACVVAVALACTLAARAAAGQDTQSGSALGVTAKDVTRLFGPPALVQSAPDGTVTWYYDGTSKGTARVVFAGDKVVRFEPAGIVEELARGPKPAPAAMPRPATDVSRKVDSQDASPISIVGIVVVGLALWLAWRYRRRLRAIELETATLEAKIQTLEERVAKFERAEAIEPPPIPQLPRRVLQPQPKRADVELTRATAAASLPVKATVLAEALPEPQPEGEATASEHAREERRQEWETVIGGNWLNKLGVLVLIIGISLFLGYSLTRLGPAGRVGVGMAAGAALLAIGMVFERKPRFLTFGRGLIGGGWAGIYFTTYAMHGLDAARVIDNPLLASSALATVATGMILHSLRYRSQVVTGLAYFVAFATLAITPVTNFSVIATVPLAASLLFVAQRFDWTPVAVVGLLATYSTYLVTNGLAPVERMDDFVRQQFVIAVYWLMFEGFDLLSERKNPGTAGRRLLLPLNACGFVGVSLLRWSSFAPQMLSAFFGIAAAAYVTSTVARALLLGGTHRSDASADSDEPLPASTSYRLSVTVAVALVCPAIYLHFSGMQFNLAFLLTAEFLFLSGVQFRDTYLRGLGAVVLSVPIVKSIGIDLPVADHLTILGWTMLRWTPVTALTAAVLYLNRALIARRARLDSRIQIIAPEELFRAVASGLLAIIIAFETPHAYLGAGWLMLALALFEIGLRRSLREFRLQAYAIGALGLMAMAGINGTDLQRGVWMVLAVDAGLVYAWVARLARTSAEQIPDSERLGCRDVCGWMGAALVAALIWTITPPAYVALAWMLFAVALFEFGLRAGIPTVRLQGYAVTALATAALFVDAFPVTVERQRLLLVVGAGSALLWAGFVRALRLSSDRIPESERARVRDASAACGTALVGILMWQLLPVEIVAIGWAVMGLILIDLGFSLQVTSLRLYGHAAMGLMLGRLLFANLTSAGTTYGVSHRLLTIAPVIALLYFVTTWLTRVERAGPMTTWERGLSRAYLYAGTIVTVLLIGFELGRATATAGWALQALGLLALGLRVKNRDLRLQSYLIAILAFVRGWATDFYSPESFAGPSDRLMTAGIVIASFYVAQLLPGREFDVTKGTAGGIGSLQAGLERHARALFSMMATVLLATLLFNEMSAGLLTIAWSIQGAVLLGAGFFFSDRTLRRSGLLLLAICTTKAFAYDFRVLDTLSRILSFIVLGILLLITSWVYARYSERLKQYL